MIITERQVGQEWSHEHQPGASCVANTSRSAILVQGLQNLYSSVRLRSAPPTNQHFPPTIQPYSLAGASHGDAREFTLPHIDVGQKWSLGGGR